MPILKIRYKYPEFQGVIDEVVKNTKKLKVISPASLEIIGFFSNVTSLLLRSVVCPELLNLSSLPVLTNIKLRGVSGVADLILPESVKKLSTTSGILPKNPLPYLEKLNLEELKSQFTDLSGYKALKVLKIMGLWGARFRENVVCSDFFIQSAEGEDSGTTRIKVPSSLEELRLHYTNASSINLKVKAPVQKIRLSQFLFSSLEIPAYLQELSIDWNCEFKIPLDLSPNLQLKKLSIEGRDISCILPAEKGDLEEIEAEGVINWRNLKRHVGVVFKGSSKGSLAYFGLSRISGALADK